MVLEDVRQERFCQEYVADPKRNGTQAAIAAGYTENRDSAAVQASRLLSSVKIKARIRELEREALATAGYSADAMRAMVMREYVRLAFSDISDFYHVSPDEDDPERRRVLDDLAALHGGQRVLDFGEVIVVPTTALPSDITAAIKTVKCNYSPKGRFLGFEVAMHDKLAALRVLAEASGVIKNELALTDPNGEPLTIRWDMSGGEKTSIVADEGGASGDA